MTNVETAPRFHTSIERDSFRHRSHLLEIAGTVADLKRHTVRPDEDHDRTHMYLMIDAAKEAGYEINNLEASDLLELALDKLLEDDRIESNYRDGTWDEYGNPIEYDKSEKAGEN